MANSWCQSVSQLHLTVDLWEVFSFVTGSWVSRTSTIQVNICKGNLQIQHNPHWSSKDILLGSRRTTLKLIGKKNTDLGLPKEQWTKKRKARMERWLSSYNTVMLLWSIWAQFLAPSSQFPVTSALGNMTFFLATTCTNTPFTNTHNKNTKKNSFGFFGHGSILL